MRGVRTTERHFTSHDYIGRNARQSISPVWSQMLETLDVTDNGFVILS